MTAQPIDTPAGAMWSPDPIRQRKANYTIEDAIDGEYKLVADATEELVLDSPFEIRLPIRELAP